MKLNSQYRRSLITPEEIMNKRTGFTLIELLVVIAIISILAAILFPVFAQAREKARQTSCLSNMNQIGLAAVMYTEDNDEFLPGEWQWSPGAILGNSPYILPAALTLQQSLQQCELCSYVKSTQVWYCPDRSTTLNSYGMSYPNMWGGGAVYNAAKTPSYSWPVGVNIAKIGSPSTNSLIAESGMWPGTAACNAATIAGIYNDCAVQYDNQHGYGYSYVYQPLLSAYSSPLPLHTGFTNIIFADGHVKAMKIENTLDPINMWRIN
jgi:prepilin-type N-terminal cleavage/methylation domain-containing protein/prepilin-type processing-associated H-X9-DG protein